MGYYWLTALRTADDIISTKQVTSITLLYEERGKIE